MTDMSEIGKRLNRRRTSLGLSLRDLAEKTDLTASFISQLECGVTNASLNSLQRISDALNVPMLYFLSEPPSGSPIVRANNRPKIDLDDERVAYELLTPDLTGKFEVVLGHIKYNSENIARRLSVETEELIFVLGSILIVGLEDGQYTLERQVVQVESGQRPIWHCPCFMGRFLMRIRYVMLSYPRTPCGKSDRHRRSAPLATSFHV